MNGLIFAMALVILALAVLLKRAINTINQMNNAVQGLIEVIYQLEEELNDKEKH